MTHPIRNAPIHIWTRTDNQPNGHKFIARFYPYNAYPVFAQSNVSAESAVADLEAIRADAIAKHEKQVIARQEQAEATRKRAEAKRAMKATSQ